jgi:mRNA-degrading endonuclease RelE of RelBE toxin-antitoxin system
MTYTLIWRNEARQALSRLRSADPASAKLIIAAVQALATEPYPGTSSQLGHSRFRRLRLDDLRVTCDVDDDRRSIQIYLVGQLPPAHRRT